MALIAPSAAGEQPACEASGLHTWAREILEGESELLKLASVRWAVYGRPASADGEPVSLRSKGPA